MLINREKAISAARKAIKCEGHQARQLEATIAEDVTKALRSLPTDDGWEEARRRFEYASRQYHNTQDWYGEESPEAGKSLHDWFMDALGPLPAPPSD